MAMSRGANSGSVSASELPARICRELAPALGAIPFPIARRAQSRADLHLTGKGCVTTPISEPTPPPPSPGSSAAGLGGVVWVAGGAGCQPRLPPHWAPGPRPIEEVWSSREGSGAIMKQFWSGIKRHTGCFGRRDPAHQTRKRFTVADAGGHPAPRGLAPAALFLTRTLSASSPPLVCWVKVPGHAMQWGMRWRVLG